MMSARGDVLSCRGGRASSLASFTLENTAILFTQPLDLFSTPATCFLRDADTTLRLTLVNIFVLLAGPTDHRAGHFTFVIAAVGRPTLIYIQICFYRGLALTLILGQVKKEAFSFASCIASIHRSSLLCVFG